MCGLGAWGKHDIRVTTATEELKGLQHHQKKSLLYFEWSLQWHYFVIVSDISSGSIHDILIFWHSVLAFYLTFYSDIPFWQSIWHLFWHPIWHPFWHLFWHFPLAFYLVFCLIIYLASILTSFRHLFWHLFWHSIYHFILASILSSRLSGSVH